MNAIVSLREVGAQMLTQNFSIRITTDTQTDLNFWVNAISKNLSRMAGGASVDHQIGSWEDETEFSVLVSVDCNDPHVLFFAILSHIRSWMVSCEQKTVWLKINEFVFIATRKQILELIDTVLEAL